LQIVNIILYINTTFIQISRIFHYSK